MFRKTVLLGLSVLLPVGLALGQSKEASGNVKAVSGDSITITDSGKDWTFVVAKGTNVTAKGASHKTADAKDAGKPTLITDFVKVNDKVTIQYTEKDGKMHASEVKVR